MARLSLHHAQRLSSSPEVLAYARKVNATFLRQGKTGIEHLDPEQEAVYLLDVATGSIAAIIVFAYFAEGKSYWIPVVWVGRAYRKQKCYPRMLAWLKNYAKSKGAKELSTEVKGDNHRMLEIQNANWELEYVRFRMAL